MDALSRRNFLRVAAAGGVGLGLIACGLDGDATSDSTSPAASLTPSPADPTSASRTAEAQTSATPEPTPRPVPPAGREERRLLAGTASETPLVMMHSGVEGPRVLVLGGVHGNEPGGWVAAEQIASWDVRVGSLLVIPRANVAATLVLERTSEALGDLNRLYPGSHEAELPMERMAAEIVDAAREFEVELLLDLHESWGFFVERTQNGTAFLGQTITSGPGPERRPAGELATVFNSQVEVERDQLVSRDFSQFPAALAEGEPRGPASTFVWRPGRGRSSLSLGQHVRGLTPVLIEMGQQRQAVERRAELHQMVVRLALEARGML